MIDRAVADDATAGPAASVRDQLEPTAVLARDVGDTTAGPAASVRDVVGTTSAPLTDTTPPPAPPLGDLAAPVLAPVQEAIDTTASPAASVRDVVGTTLAPLTDTTTGGQPPPQPGNSGTHVAVGNPGVSRLPNAMPGLDTQAAPSARSQVFNAAGEVSHGIPPGAIRSDANPTASSAGHLGATATRRQDAIRAPPAALDRPQGIAPEGLTISMYPAAISSTSAPRAPQGPGAPSQPGMPRVGGFAEGTSPLLLLMGFLAVQTVLLSLAAAGLGRRLQVAQAWRPVAFVCPFERPG